MAGLDHVQGPAGVDTKPHGGIESWGILWTAVLDCWPHICPPKYETGGFWGWPGWTREQGQWVLLGPMEL